MLCLALAAFVSIFAFDVFKNYQSFWDIMLALVLHLMPTFIILGILKVAWRKEWFGALFFPLLGALYIYLAWGKWTAIAIVSGSLFILGILFMISFKAKER